MSDAFLVGAGFSKAMSPLMPTMKELHTLLEGLIGNADGFTREAYDYADGDVEALLSYYAIPNPHDDAIEALRKRRVTALVELGIGLVLEEREIAATNEGLNPNGTALVSRWHEQCSHILTTNYDTLIERLASRPMSIGSDDRVDSVYFTDLYPIAVSPAVARDGTALLGSEYPETLTLYKLHGSISWYKTFDESSYDPIYGLAPGDLGVTELKKFIADKRRFIVPPVYDKSSLLSHETVRSLWWQARSKALREADAIYVIGYSLPETDIAMQNLLWEGARNESGRIGERRPLYVIDVDCYVVDRFASLLGRYYDIKGDYAGTPDTFDRFVGEYC